MKIYMIAGEASGDLHGSHLIKSLLGLNPEMQIRCWGGDKMKAAGGQLVKHIKDLAFMGFWEVLKHLPTILSNLSFCKKDIAAFQPDAVILIDYPGFNFRLFPFLKENNFPIYYYISPQLWAWKTGRLKKVREYVSRMIVIFPFEKAFYEKHGIEVDYFGHPLLDELKPIQQNENPSKKIIAILPGSRKHVIAYLLPEYLKVIKHFPDYRFKVAGMSTIGKEFYRKIINDSNCELVMDETYNVLKEAEAAIVTSGTATLETALHRVPEVICYKGSPISYQIAKRLIKGIQYICIVNLICDRPIVKELIQQDVNESNLAKEVRYLLSIEGKLFFENEYTYLREQLGNAGASKRVATKILSMMSAQKN